MELGAFAHCTDRLSQLFFLLTPLVFGQMPAYLYVPALRADQQMARVPAEPGGPQFYPGPGAWKADSLSRPAGEYVHFHLVWGDADDLVPAAPPEAVQQNAPEQREFQPREG